MTYRCKATHQGPVAQSFVKFNRQLSNPFSQSGYADPISNDAIG